MKAITKQTALLLFIIILIGCKEKNEFSIYDLNIVKNPEWIDSTTYLPTIKISCKNLITNELDVGNRIFLLNLGISTFESSFIKNINSNAFETNQEGMIFFLWEKSLTVYKDDKYGKRRYEQLKKEIETAKPKLIIIDLKNSKVDTVYYNKPKILEW